MPQAAEQTTDPATGWWDAWTSIAEEPALVEFLLFAVVALVFVLLNFRISKLVRESRDRAAVKDYLLGVEQALSGDLSGARKRLERVLAEDPENHHARLMYGEVLASLGEAAEAHRHHLFLQKAFQVHTQRNELDLGSNLLAAGKASEAVESARRAVAAKPSDQAALELLFRSELAAGYPEAAGRTGGRLAGMLGDSVRAQRVRDRAAEALALASQVQAAGDARRAMELAEEAQRLAPDAPAVRTLTARLVAVERGMDAAMALLGDGAAKALPVGDQTAVVSTPARLPVPTSMLAALVPATRYRCDTCGGGVDRPASACPHCGAATVWPAERGLFGSIESPTNTMDEIDANKVHVRKQLDAALRGDQSAADDLLEIGEPAVEHLLSAAVRNAGTSETVVTTLRRMGPEILPELFASYARLKELRLRNLTTLLHGSAGVGVMGRVVQGFGREALAYFEQLLDTSDRDLRKILLDFYIGLGDQEEFHRVLEHYAPIEVIHRLNAAEPASLRKLLASAESCSFLTDTLLLEPTFQRAEDLLLAIVDAKDSDVLVRVLQRRGYSSSLAPALINQLEDPVLSEPAAAVLDSYGVSALDHVLSAFADLDRPESLRARLSERAGTMGTAVVGEVCGLIGPSASALDTEILSLLQRIGADAKDALLEAYNKTSLVEKLGGTLVGRYTHRRVVIVRALVAVGSWDVLERLRETETDPNLKLRIAQALQGRPATENETRPGEDHGQVG